MVDSLYCSSRKIPDRCENSCGLQNKLPKALLFNEANHEIFELSHCLEFLIFFWEVDRGEGSEGGSSPSAHPAYTPC